MPVTTCWNCKTKYVVDVVLRPVGMESCPPLYCPMCGLGGQADLRTPANVPLPPPINITDGVPSEEHVRRMRGE